MTDAIRLLDDALIDAERRIPQQCALVVGARRYSYGELSDSARRIAAVLIRRGVKRSDRVAIYMNNTFACAASIYGTLFAGAVFVLVNPQTKSERLRYILDDSGSVAVITEGELSGTAGLALDGSSSVKAVLCAESAPQGGGGVSSRTEELWPLIDSTTPLARPVFHIPNDLASLIYTSGSTGNPKGVMMTHQSMVFAAGSVIEYLELRTEHRLFNFLPLSYSYGLYHLLMSVVLGSTLVLERSFAFPARAIQMMGDERITLFPAVPTVFTILIGLHRRSPISFPSVLQVTNAAAALPASYNQELHEIFPNARIYRMYGLTECKRVCYLDPALVDVKPNSVGQAIPGTEILLLGEDGRTAEPGVPGILYVRGPHLMQGYWRQPELSLKMLKDGLVQGEHMLCTQDWFMVDEDGDLYFQGRSDDIIKTGGEKVSPVEVENVLFDIEGVKQAAVIGVPDRLLGQAITAYVVLDEGIRMTAQDVMRACAQRLEGLLVPKYIEFCEELPKTESGKIRKATLRKMSGAAHEMSSEESAALGRAGYLSAAESRGNDTERKQPAH